MSKSIIFTTLGILLAATVIMAGSAAFAAEAPGTAPRRDRPLSVVFESKNMATLSAEIPTKVIAVKKQMGDSFSKGDVLVEFDDTVYKANLVRAQSEVSATHQALKVAKKMSSYKSATPLDIANARKEAGSASASLMVAKKEMDDAVIKAPFNGVVKQVLVRDHEWVDQGTPVIEVVDDSVLRANILMPSTGYGRISLGQEVSISVNETGETVSCKITHISKVLDPASGTFEVYGEVPNQGGKIVSGMTGTLIMGQ